MNKNDPNDPMMDADRTMLVPTPGGRRTPAAAAPAASAAPTSVPGAALNALVRAANPLLELVTPLRHMAAHPDVEGLRLKLIEAVKKFEAAAKQDRVAHESIAAARYALCTLLDETISSTPWGGGGVWASRSLLVAFHNEASGGEKFFLILQKLGQDARANLFTLELMYLCLAFGLEGRYRVIEGGRAQLEQLRERLQLLVAQQRGLVEPELSVHWKGASGEGEPLWRVVPVWILAAGAGALLIALQLYLGSRLSSASDPVFASLLGIRTAAVAAPLSPPVLPPATPVRLAAFLRPEIARGELRVVETPERSIVTVPGSLFGSGSADVDSGSIALLQRIGDALKTVPGKIVVVGHTDNQKPGLSARFPSNFELSSGRAAAVRELLAQRAGPAGRYSVEGRADAEPLAPNNSPANRAGNRRVDIIVLTPAVAP